MIEIRLIDSLGDVQLEQLRQLYIAAGWLGVDEPWDFLPEILKRTEAAVGAFDGDDMIGFGRAVSDGCSDAYIQDVVVDDRRRGQGTGGAIVLTLKKILSERKIDWIALVGEPGTENFYRRLGLEAQKGYTFWKFPKR